MSGAAALRRPHSLFLDLLLLLRYGELAVEIRGTLQIVVRFSPVDVGVPVATERTALGEQACEQLFQLSDFEPGGSVTNPLSTYAGHWLSIPRTSERSTMTESEKIRGIIESAVESAFIMFPNTGNGDTWPPNYKETAECKTLATAVLSALENARYKIVQFSN